MVEALSLDVERYELAAMRIVADWAHAGASTDRWPSVLERAADQLNLATTAGRIFASRQRPTPGIYGVLERELYAARSAGRRDIGDIIARITAAAPLGEPAVQAELDSWARRGIAGPKWRGRTWAFTTWVERRSGHAATLARAVRARGG